MPPPGPKPPDPPPIGDPPPALVVPVDVQAMVVNHVPRAFRQWRFNYEALGSYDSPEPEAGGGQATTTARSPGIYLHWDLPDGLRHGTGGQDGDVTYPAAPNRWLVVRYSGLPAASRGVTGWVVESDCPNADSPALYLVDDTILQSWTASGDPRRVQGAQDVRRVAQANNGALVAQIGLPFPLTASGGWSERAAGTSSFLTAVAPGNILFSRYETHCANVFTFYDAMTGVAEGDLVTYLVVGWYAHAADDVLTTTTPTALGWAVPAGFAPTASVYQGLALDVPWLPSAGTTPPSPLDGLTGNVHVGVGNTTVDAFTALVAGRLDRPAAVDLLQAFHYGLLPELEAINGPDLLATAVHQAAFGSQPGALSWEIVDTTGDGATADLSPTVAAWLADLNEAQATLDTAQTSLDAHRWALYALWWKWQKGLYQSEIVPLDGFDPDAYEAAVRTTLPGLLSADHAAVSAQLPKVPQPVVQPGDTRQQSFERGIADLAAARGLGAGMALRAVTGSRSWRSADPVVVLSGINPGPLPDPSATLPCRRTGDLVAELHVGTTPVGAAQLGAARPALPAAAAVALPAFVSAFVLEAFLLDPASAGAIARATGLQPAAVTAAVTGHPAASYPGEVLPAKGLATWALQPWQPLAMEWQVGWVSIPDQTSGVDNWAFDGTDYSYTGPFGPFASDSAAPVQAVGGISPLTPEAQFTFRARLQKFVDDFVTGNPNAPADAEALAALETAIDQAGSWKFMSQALVGLGDIVAARDTRAHTGPDSTIAAAVAGRAAGVPYIPNGPEPRFDPLRQGQLAVQFLLVYDTFGQVLQIVGGTGSADPQNFVPTVDPALRPDKPVITRNPGRLVELRPRLQQPSRLDVAFVDARDDTVAVVAGGPANPVAAWLLPNHLDDGILLYAPDGRALGEVRLLADAAGTRTAQWQPPPHDPITLDDVRALAPHLAAMITAPAFTAATAFQTLLTTIDTTLWSVDPLGDRADQNLSVLVGRPLALLRVGARLSVDGQPLAAQSDWPNVWPPPAPDFLTRKFEVRLGDLAGRQDGLVGFFTGDDYGTFNSVAAPDPEVTQGYVRQIGPIGRTDNGNWLTLRYGDAAPTYLSLLVDPRAAVHFVTGILPTKALTLPDTFVRGALSQLELTFRIGSLLTHSEQSPATGDAPPAFPESMWLPHPTEQAGAWSWWEPDRATGSGWASYGLLRATADARLKDYASTLRDGFLQFDTDLAPPPGGGADEEAS